MEKKINLEIHSIKEKLIDLLYWIFTILMWFALAGSIYRSSLIGIKPINYLQIFLVLIFLLVFIYRKRINYNIKSWVLLLTVYILGVSAIFTFGLQSQGLYILMLFSILTSALINQKWGLIAFSITLTSILIAAYLHTTLMIPENKVLTSYSHSVQAWAMAILVFSIITWIILIFWQRILLLLVSKVEVSLIHEETLNKVNRLLSKEIESRKIAEQLLNDNYRKTKKLNKEYQDLNEKLQEANDKLEKSNQFINEAKHKVQTADKLKSSFLSNMSHEIRTPMNAIVGFASLIGSDDISNEDKHNYLNIIQSSTNGLLNTISDIITMARIESGEFTLYPSSINLNNFIDDLEEHFSRELNIQKGSNVRLIIEKNFNASSNIITDSESLNQMVRKLIDNAVKFTNEGFIKVKLDLINNGFLTFHIEDSGIGIPQGTKAEIFDTFRQIDSGNTRRYGGVGIGLSIAKGLIDLLNGTIEFSSTPEKGTIFTFAIPVVIQSTIKDTLQKTDITLLGKTILIIGKNTWDNRNINQYLQETNSILIYVETGFQGIDTVKEHPEINLVIMSMFLPDMNGYEVARILKSNSPQLPILAHMPDGNLSINPSEKQNAWDDFIDYSTNKEDLLSIISRFLK